MGAGFARYGVASSFFLANSSEEFDSPETFSTANERVVPPTARRGDQHDASADQAGRTDRLARDRSHVRGVVHLRTRLARLVAASVGRAAVPACL